MIPCDGSVPCTASGHARDCRHWPHVVGGGGECPACNEWGSGPERGRRWRSMLEVPPDGEVFLLWSSECGVTGGGELSEVRGTVRHGVVVDVTPELLGEHALGWSRP